MVVAVVGRVSGWGERGGGAGKGGGPASGRSEDGRSGRTPLGTPPCMGHVIHGLVAAQNQREVYAQRRPPSPSPPLPSAPHSQRLAPPPALCIPPPLAPSSLLQERRDPQARPRAGHRPRAAGRLGLQVPHAPSLLRGRHRHVGPAGAVGRARNGLHPVPEGGRAAGAKPGRGARGEGRATGGKRAAGRWPGSGGSRACLCGGERATCRRCHAATRCTRGVAPAGVWGLPGGTWPASKHRSMLLLARVTVREIMTKAQEACVPSCARAAWTQASTFWAPASHLCCVVVVVVVNGCPLRRCGT